MGSGSGANTWKIVIGLAVVCGVLVFAGGFMHRRSLEASVLDTQDASATYVKTKLTHQVEDLDLSEPLGDAASTSLAKDVDPPGEDGVRVFAPNGTAVFTEGVDAFPADTEALLTAKAGGVSRVIDGADLRIYAPIEGKGGRVGAIAAVVSNYTQMRKEAGGPLDDYRLPLVGVGVLLLVVGLVLMLKSTKASAPVAAAAAAVVAPPRQSKGKVTGFEAAAPPVDPAPATLQLAVTDAAAEALGGTVAAPEPEKQRFRLGKKAPPAQAAPDAAPKEKRSMFGRRSAPADEAVVSSTPGDASATALQREVKIREALEDQLEQLRTQVKTQQDERLTATRELTAQLEEATQRADDAEARLELGDSSGGAAERVVALEQELAQAKLTAADAIARADHLQRAAEAAPPPPGPSVDQRVTELTAQLTDAQQRASSAEQRAASVESVRDELEVRVAQLGAKASELEQRAGDLETSLQEANAGGDAVRAEIAALTAALAGANARVQELESAPASPSDHAVDQGANEAEIARLRGELANQLERAQSAEDRIATLEADVLAAARGVSALPVENGSESHGERETPSDIEAPSHVEPPSQVETPSYVEASTTVEAPRTEPLHTEPPRESVPPAPADDDRYGGMWSTPYAAPEPERPESDPVAHTSDPEPAQASETSERASDGAVEAPQAETSGGADDELGADDDMWSLRARLADAAARKRRHIE
jgi:hypothetical protein